MYQSEEDILKSICAKHGVNPSHLNELFAIEKEYADRNLSRRRGIYQQISESIVSWIEENERKNSI